MVDRVKRKNYIPQTYVFDDAFNPDIHNKWLNDNSWMIWGEYFKCFRWWLRHRKLNNFPYVVFAFDDINLKVYFKIEEMSECFRLAINYFVEVEDYEMCAYIKHLAEQNDIIINRNDE